MNIMAVDPTKIDGIWPRVKGNVQRVIDTQVKHKAMSDYTFNIDQTKEFIRSKAGCMLIISEDEEIIASLIVEVLRTEVGKSLVINTLGGDRIYEWRMLLLDTLKNIAYNIGCNDIRIYMVRRAWQRCMKPFGFELIGDREYAGVSYPCLSYEVN